MEIYHVKTVRKAIVILLNFTVVDEVWGMTHVNKGPPWVWFTAAAALWGRGRRT